MKKNIFGQLLLVFSFICLICACSYYTYEKGLVLGKFTGALQVCSEIDMVLSINLDNNQYICLENKTIQEENLKFNVEDYYVT